MDFDIQLAIPATSQENTCCRQLDALARTGAHKTVCGVDLLS